MKEYFKLRYSKVNWLDGTKCVVDLIYSPDRAFGKWFGKKPVVLCSCDSKNGIIECKRDKKKIVEMMIDKIREQIYFDLDMVEEAVDRE